MPSFTVSLSEHILNLPVESINKIDGIEFNPFDSAERIAEYRSRIKALPFYFHAGSLLSHVRWKPGTLSRLPSYLELCQAPWISIHLELLPWWYYQLTRLTKIVLKSPAPQKMKAQTIRRTDSLRKRLPRPIILENLPVIPYQPYAYAVDPLLITSVIESLDVPMLLDLAHARISAEVLKMDVQAYLSSLPLERVVQIHTSGPRRVNGYLQDAHKPLQTEDYELLRWTLPRTNPKFITLEYFRELGDLMTQIDVLRDIMDDLR